MKKGSLLLPILIIITTLTLFAFPGAGSATDYVPNTTYTHYSIISSPFNEPITIEKNYNNYADALSAAKNMAHVAMYREDVQSKIATLNNEEFINYLYDGLFHRTPEEAGFAGWLVDLNNGWSRSDVIDHFINSPEFEMRYVYGYDVPPAAVSANDYVPNTTYTHYSIISSPFNEPITIGKNYNNYADALSAAKNMAHVAMYRADVQSKIATLTNEGFINYLYDGLFHRTPEEAGFAGWLVGLNNGWSRSDVIDHFINSPEFEMRYVYGYDVPAVAPVVVPLVIVDGNGHDVTINSTVIAGVTAPVTGATPVTTITDTTEYTATIAWAPTSTPFAAITAYTATITITPKTGYTLTGVAANFFTVAGATATNSADSGVVSAVFPATAAQLVQATPTFSPVAGAVEFGSTVAITSAGADAIYYTTDNSDPTISSTNQATTPLVINAAGTIKAIAVKAGSTNSAIGSAAYTQAAATAPSTVVLAVGGATPVGGVTNVAIPAAGATDTTGAVTGWVTGTADKIKFTVTDAGEAVSEITINTVAYTNGADYTIAAATSLPIVVTTSEAGRVPSVRTFTVTVAAQLAIGQSYQGGIIAYIDNTGLHGLIAAPSDQSTGVWHATNDGVTGASGTAIGTGNANTNAIIALYGAENNAAKICADLTIKVGGVTYSDWYLPSNDELKKLWDMLGNTSGKRTANGFADVNYWSSTENDYDHAWFLNFGNNDGYQGYAAKSNTLSVRAVRTF